MAGEAKRQLVRDALQKLNADHEAVVEKLKADGEADLKYLKAAHEAELEQLQKRIAELESAAAAKVQCLPINDRFCPTLSTPREVSGGGVKS